MPTFEQGDVVRVAFPYTDRETRQHWPALVLSRVFTACPPLSDFNEDFVIHYFDQVGL